MNVGEWVRKWGLLAPGKTAIIDDGREFSYEALNRRCNTLANFLLEKGVKKGDRVGVLMHNGHEILEVYLASAKLGAIFIPLNWRKAPPEIEYMLRDSGTTFLFFHEDFLDTTVSIKNRLEELRHYVVLGEADSSWAEHYDDIDHCPSTEPSGLERPGFEDRHVIIYTSGTTGSPKGVVLSNRKTFYNALNANIFYGLMPSDILLVNRPLFHSGGLLVNVTPAFYKGATCIFKRRFSPREVLETVEEYGVTIFEVSATLLNFILRDCDVNRYDLRSIKACYTGGERVSTTMLSEYHKRGIPVSQIFGLTETSTLTWLPPHDAVRKAGSVGKPVFHGELRILDPDKNPIRPGETGEISVQGPILMSGYWNRPDLTEKAMENGWFRTGDLATIDEEGYIYIVDRKRDMFISGGENVSPAEIEKQLLANPKIFDVAVYGVPDERWGEVGKASIILKEGEILTPEEVVRFLKGKIGKFKIPKYVEFIDALPRTASGKIRKYRLIEKFDKKEIPVKA